jgi:Tfp pilus assembly protein FimT
MVTIVIILVLSGMSISAYLKFNKSQTVETDARELISQLNRARSLASNLVYPSGCNSLLGYNAKSVDVNGVHNGLVITALCSPQNISSPTAKVLLNTYFSQPIDITFIPGSGYLSTGTDLDIIIKDKVDVSTTKKITVGTYGLTFLN